MDFDVVNRKLLLELLAAASPELTFGDTVEHIVRLTREFFGVDRVGFFIVDKEKGSLILKVTQEGAGLRVPLKGIAGHIARTGQTVNIEDAYLDERFDPTMVTVSIDACMLGILMMPLPGHEHWLPHKTNALCPSVRLSWKRGRCFAAYQHA